MMTLQMKRKNRYIIFDYILIFVIIILYFSLMVIISSVFQRIILLSETIINYLLLVIMVVAIFTTVKKYFYMFPRRYLLSTNYLEIEYLFKHRKIYYKSILSIEEKKYKSQHLAIIRMAFKERTIYLNQYSGVEAFFSQREINKLLHQHQVEN